MAGTSDNLESLSIIGWVRTPFKATQEIPIQGTANDAKGCIEILPAFSEGLADLAGFDRIWLIYLARPSGPIKPKIVPRLDTSPRGVFATRSLIRPNPIGLTCVKLIRVEGPCVHVEGVDMLDGTALLDLKPYVPRYDAFPDAWSGWLENRIPHQQAWKD
jgi:tRNA-Thr(GGU) m(6)t(6)A37 methyltransferase TsaA